MKIKWFDAEIAFNDYKKGNKSLFPIDEDQYWQLLECVPPRKQGRIGFLNGEPYSNTVYMACLERGDNYYMTMMTPEQFSNFKWNEYKIMEVIK